MVNHVRIVDYMKFLKERISSLNVEYLNAEVALKFEDSQWELRNWFYRNWWVGKPSHYWDNRYIKRAAQEAQIELDRATYHYKINELMINCTYPTFFTWARENGVPY